VLIRALRNVSGPGSSVGIATDHGLGGPMIESRWERDFPPVKTGPGAHQTSCTMGTGSLPGIKCGRGLHLTTHPLSSAAVMEEYTYTSTHTLGHTRPVTGLRYLHLRNANILYEMIELKEILLNLFRLKM
jgi:hypothetical protein